VADTKPKTEDKPDAKATPATDAKDESATKADEAAEEAEAPKVSLKQAVAQLNEAIDEIADDGVEWTQVRQALNAATERASFLHKVQGQG
jgi:hypothetical protein